MDTAPELSCNTSLHGVTKVNITLVRLCESRWPECGECLVGDHCFLLTSPTNSSGLWVIVLAMPVNFWYTHLSCELINDHLLVAHFQYKLGKLSVISAYAPTDVAEDHTKDEFYCKPKYVLNSLSPHDFSLVLTVMDATVSSLACDPNIVPHVTGMMFVGHKWQ